MRIIICFIFFLSACSKDKPDLNISMLPRNKISWQTDCSKCSEQTKNVAVMIEPRNSEPVVEIVHNFIDNLIPQDEWTIQLFHSSVNEQKIKNDQRISELIKSCKIILSKLSVDNLTVPLYDSIIYDIDFWHDLRGKEKVLIFQTDTGLCPKPHQSLSSYLEKYDFAGAPWGEYGPLCALFEIGKKSYVDFIAWGTFNHDNLGQITQQYRENFNNDEANNLRFQYAHVGNGGLSIYDKKKWISALEKYYPVSHSGNLPGADLFYACVGADDFTIAVPTPKEAVGFSIETSFNNINIDHPVGFHKPWLYLTNNELDALGKRCPVLLKVSKKFFGTRWGRE